jgi:hypothetical protein
MDLTDHKDENLWLMKGDCLELHERDTRRFC